MVSTDQHFGLVQRSIALITHDAAPNERRSRLLALRADVERQLQDEDSRDALFVVRLTHERLGLRRVGLEADERLSAEADLAEIAIQIIERATLQAARDTIHSDSYDTVGEYEAAVERRSRSFQIVSIERPANARRWRVRGQGAEGPFESDIQAATQRDAEFQAQWEHSSNSEPVTRDNASQHLGALFDVRISDVMPNPVTLRELYDGIVAALGQGPDATTWRPHITDGEAWDALRAQVEKLTEVFGTAPTGGAA